jgi:CRP-like cAMP-binding protein
MYTFGAAPEYDSEPDTAFPRLDAEELAVVAGCGHAKRFATGASLFRTGDNPLARFVVMDGAIGMLAGRPALADGRALVDSEVVRLNAQLRQLLVVSPVIGEKWIPALIRRRTPLLARGRGHEGLRIFGHGDDPATLRACGFLYRNGVPHSGCRQKSCALGMREKTINVFTGA